MHKYTICFLLFIIACNNPCFASCSKNRGAIESLFNGWRQVKEADSSNGWQDEINEYHRETSRRKHTAVQDTLECTTETRYRPDGSIESEIKKCTPSIVTPQAVENNVKNERGTVVKTVFGAFASALIVRAISGLGW